MILFSASQTFFEEDIEEQKITNLNSKSLLLFCLYILASVNVVINFLMVIFKNSKIR